MLMHRNCKQMHKIFLQMKLLIRIYLLIFQKLMELKMKNNRKALNLLCLFYYFRFIITLVMN